MGKLICFFVQLAIAEMAIAGYDRAELRSALDLRLEQLVKARLFTKFRAASRRRVVRGHFADANSLSGN